MSTVQQRRMQETLLSTKQVNFYGPEMQNKWTQERLVKGNVRNGDVQNMPNSKYFSICAELVLEEHLGKLVKWVSTISETHKKGLRTIKQVLEHRGTKRFKPYNFGQDVFGIDDLNMEQCTIKDAKQTFKLLNSKTAYGAVFGEGPKKKDDYKITPAAFKQIVSVLKQPQIGYMDKWLNGGINDQEEFAKRIIITMRELYTVIKQQQSTRAEADQGFEVKSNYRGAEPPRFDQAETMLREAQRKRGVERDGGYKTKKYPYVPQSYKFPGFEPLVRHEEAKQQMLKGDLEAVYYLAPETQHFTHNRGIHFGKQQTEDQKARICDSFKVSCAGLGALPDPEHIRSQGRKYDQFKSDAQTISARLFQRNAINSMTPTARNKEIDGSDNIWSKARSSLRSSTGVRHKKY